MPVFHSPYEFQRFHERHTACAGYFPGTLKREEHGEPTAESSGLSPCSLCFCVARQSFGDLSQPGGGGLSHGLALSPCEIVSIPPLLSTRSISQLGMAFFSLTASAFVIPGPTINTLRLVSLRRLATAASVALV